MKKRSLFALLGAFVLCAGQVPGTAAAQDALQDRLNSLEQKVKALEEAQTGAKTPALSTAGKDGFSLKSADGSFKLRLSGLIQVDSRQYANDKGSAFPNQFLLRRVRPIFEGTINKFFDFKIIPDFGGTSGGAALQDTFLEFAYYKPAKLRIGKFKSPVGLERLQSTSQLTFVETGLSTNLTPNYDIGIQVGGDILNDTVNYAVALVNGAVDNASVSGDNGDAKDYAARLFAMPFKNGPAGALKDLGIGVGASRGRQTGSGLPTYVTNGQNPFFSYRGTTAPDGTRKRIAPQTYWYPANYGVLAEYVISSQEVRRNNNRANLKNKGWQAQASWVATGEKASYKSVRPRNDFNPETRAWGAFELAARYSELVIDKDAFPIYADPTVSARKARAWTGGVNWYLTSNVKVQSNYEYTRFQGGGAEDRPIERAVLSRVQLAF